MGGECHSTSVEGYSHVGIVTWLLRLEHRHLFTSQATLKTEPCFTQSGWEPGTLMLNKAGPAEKYGKKMLSDRGSGVYKRRLWGRISQLCYSGMLQKFHLASGDNSCLRGVPEQTCWWSLLWLQHVRGALWTLWWQTEWEAWLGLSLGYDLSWQ